MQDKMLEDLAHHKASVMALFEFIQSSPVLASLAQWTTEKAQNPAQTTEVSTLLARHGATLPPGMTVQASEGNCLNFCVGGWCPIHYHAGGSFHLGSCAEDVPV